MKSGSDQLRWVLLLLAIAVILPTVCLLWFMTQAVKNERLVVRQKLGDIYVKKAQYFFVQLPDTYFDSYLKRFEPEVTASPSVIYDTFAVKPEGICQGMLIYDANGNLSYPYFLTDDQTNEQSDQLAKPFPNKTKETIELAYKLSYPDKPENIKPAAVAVIMRCRVFLAEFYLETKDENLYYHLRRVLGNSHYDDEKENGFLVGPAETTIWQLEKLIAIARKAGFGERLNSEIQIAQNRIAAYQNAIEAAYLYPTAESLNGWPDRTIRKFPPKLNLYGLKFKLADRTILGISSSDKMFKILAAAIEDMQDDTVGIAVYDNLGDVVAGNADKIVKPFWTLKAGKYLPDFTAAVYFKNICVFEKAASRQTAMYIWTGVLAVLLIITVAIFGGSIIARQARLNKLKNDFIATISHELRTPLASMRVLVDTLLEGRYKDQQQVREYLELASKENARLSRLIDNFLTFSRMERNKQAFDLTPCSSSQIARDAAESVKTKFEQHKCAPTVEIAEDLSDINADHDAMVTVLVNLLDNACKYTYDDKQISLKVYKQNSDVCFEVKDNGIGLSRRAMRKIFDKFYQVDSSLARRAEGCGLGLSIVKFIVDAHHGKINVESKPGKGSAFTVKLPALT